MEGGGDKTPSLTLSTCPVLNKGASNITNVKTCSFKVSGMGVHMIIRLKSTMISEQIMAYAVGLLHN